MGRRRAVGPRRRGTHPGKRLRLVPIEIERGSIAPTKLIRAFREASRSFAMRSRTSLTAMPRR
jgi:hypothetical protein